MAPGASCSTTSSSSSRCSRQVASVLIARGYPLAGMTAVADADPALRKPGGIRIRHRRRWSPVERDGSQHPQTGSDQGAGAVVSGGVILLPVIDAARWVAGIGSVLQVLAVAAVPLD